VVVDGLEKRRRSEGRWRRRWCGSEVPSIARSRKEEKG